MASDIPDCLEFDSYHAQMWNAVDCSDYSTVRKLINCWCRVDIRKGDMSLKELALTRGTDQVITLVLKMESTLKFIHGVIENKTEDIKALLDLHKDDININFPNMKYMSVTALYFSVRNRNSEITKIILDAGGKLEHCLVLPDQSELPLLFYFMQWNLPDEMFDLVLLYASSRGLLEHLRYRSLSLLHWWCQRCASRDERLLLKLVDLSSPRLLSTRDEKNQTILDMCSGVSHLREDILTRIKCKFNNANEEQLLLEFITCGFDYTWEIVHEESLSPALITFARSLERCIYRFVCAVEYGDFENVCKYTYFKSDSQDICLVNCRNVADGQPPLHKAVLKQNPLIVRHFCEILLHSYQIKLDSIRDNFNRTALSYAYAFPAGSQEVVNLLLDHGSSEFTLDKDDRSPQLFREARDHPLMHDFILFHQNGDYRNAEAEEPFIWKVRTRVSIHAPNCYRRCCTLMSPAAPPLSDQAALRDSDSTNSSLSDFGPPHSSNSFTCSHL